MMAKKNHHLKFYFSFHYVFLVILASAEHQNPIKGCNFLSCVSGVSEWHEDHATRKNKCPVLIYKIFWRKADSLKTKIKHQRVLSSKYYLYLKCLTCFRLCDTYTQNQILTWNIIYCNSSFEIFLYVSDKTGK